MRQPLKARTAWPYPIVVTGLPSRLDMLPEMHSDSFPVFNTNGVLHTRSACLLSIAMDLLLRITLLTCRVNRTRTAAAPCHGIAMYTICSYHPSGSSPQTPQSSTNRGSRARCVSPFARGLTWLNFSIPISVRCLGAARATRYPSIVAQSNAQVAQHMFPRLAAGTGMYICKLSIEQLKHRISKWSIREGERPGASGENSVGLPREPIVDDRDPKLLIRTHHPCYTYSQHGRAAESLRFVQ